ncbi:hypothetical protein EYR40_010526 [Pleurotus pulmonarius]|nr:hypothetical protein EYR40_010526 [Pleurotus pulmonarius]
MTLTLDRADACDIEPGSKTRLVIAASSLHGRVGCGISRTRGVLVRFEASDDGPHESRLAGERVEQSLFRAGDIHDMNTHSQIPARRPSVDACKAGALEGAVPRVPQWLDMPLVAVARSPGPVYSVVRERSSQPSANVYAGLHLVYAVSNGAHRDDEAGNQPDEGSSRSAQIPDDSPVSESPRPVSANPSTEILRLANRDDADYPPIPPFLLSSTHRARGSRRDPRPDPPIRQAHKVHTTRRLPTALRVARPRDPSSPIRVLVPVYALFRPPPHIALDAE